MGREDPLRLRHPDADLRRPTIEATVLSAATARMPAVESVRFGLPGPF